MEFSTDENKYLGQTLELVGENRFISLFSELINLRFLSW